VVIVCSNQQAKFVPWQDFYTIEVDRRNRNCYNYGGFEHLARNCRNKETGGRIGKSKRLEYGNKSNEQRRIIKEGNKPSNLNYIPL